MLLAHHHVEPRRPRPVLLAEPTGLQPLGMGRLVLLPQQRQRHALAAQLAVHLTPPRHRTPPRVRRRRREQPPLQPRIIHRVRQQRPPRVGELVEMRSRRWLVEAVETSAPPASPRVSLACADDDAQGQTLEVYWDFEIDRRILEQEAWSAIGARGFDPPRHFSALCRRPEGSDPGDSRPAANRTRHAVVPETPGEGLSALRSGRRRQRDRRLPGRMKVLASKVDLSLFRIGVCPGTVRHRDVVQNRSGCKILEAPSNWRRIESSELISICLKNLKIAGSIIGS